MTSKRDFLDTLLKSVKSPTLSLISEVKELSKSITDDHLPAKPERLSATYVNDYDITIIHNHVLAYFSYESVVLLQDYKNQLARETAKIKTKQKVSERIQSNKIITDLDTKIADIKNGTSKSYYERKSAKLINKYNKLGPSTILKDFTTNTEVQTVDHDISVTSEKRHKMIEKFVALASKYIEVDIVRVLPQTTVCGNCASVIDESQIEYNTNQRCEFCGEDIYISSSSSSDDSVTQVEKYEDRENLRKAMIRFQCRQDVKLPEQLFTDLDAYFKRNGELTGKKIRNNYSLDSRGRREGTSLAILHRVLKETGYKEYYEDAWLIAHRYWGWRAHDISHLEEVIMNDYDKTQEVWRRLERTRTSSLGTQYRLFKHLEMRGYKCYVDDFKIAESTESFDFHETAWKLMCEGANDPMIKFIPTHK